MKRAGVSRTHVTGRFFLGFLVLFSIPLHAWQTVCPTPHRAAVTAAPQPIVIPQRNQKAIIPQRITVSAADAMGHLTIRIPPPYPAIARMAHVQGTVELRAVVSKEGLLHDLVAVSGPPMLMPSAIETVKQWRYMPFLIGGQPVEADIPIKITYTLSGG